jgi:hypothetical protein
MYFLKFDNQFVISDAPTTQEDALKNTESFP